MKKTRTKWMWGVLVLFLVLSAVLIIIPFLLNPEYLKQMAFDQIQRTFGPHISIGRTTLSMFPHPRIEVRELVVKESPDTHAFFRSEFLSLELKIGPLLRQELVIKELKIHQPEIELKRDQDGRWHIFNTPLGKSDTTVLASVMNMERVTILDGQVTVIDESPADGVRGLMLDQVLLTVYSHGEESRTADLELSGQIRRPKKGSAFSISGQLGPSPLELGSPLLRSPPTSPQWQFDGHIDVSNINLGDAAELFQIERFPSELLALTHVQSKLKVLAGQTGYDLLLSDFSVKSRRASFSGNASIAGLTAADPTIAVTFSASPMSVDTMYQAIPSNWLPGEVRQIWNESAIDGTVEVIQATVTGSSRSDVGMSVVGTFHLKNGFLRSEGRWPDTDNVSGKVVVEPDRIKFVDFSALYDAIPVRSAQGRVLFKEAGPWMEVDLEGAVPANKVLSVLTQLSDTNPVLRRMSTWKVTKGIGLLTLRFAGFLKGLEGLSFQHGDYVAQELQIHLPEIEEPIANGQGWFKFSPSETSFENVIGWIGGDQFVINGGIQTEQAPTFHGFNLQATIEGRRILDTWISEPQPDGLMVVGPVVVNTVLSGPVVTPHIKGDLDLVNLAFHIPSVLKKANGVPGSLAFEGGVLRNGAMLFERLELSLLPFRLKGKGALALSPTLQIHGRFNTEPIYLGLLPDGVTIGGGLLRSGILEVSLDVKGRGDDWRQWRTKGWVALTEGIMDIKDLPDPVTNLFLRLKIDSDVADLQRVEFRIKDSDARLRGSVENWKRKPDINVTIESSKFDIDLVIPKKGRSPLRDFLEVLAGGSSVEGTLTIDQPRYKALPLKNLAADLRIHDGLVTIDRIRGESEGGPVAGRVFIHLPEKKPAAVRASFHIKGLPFEQLHQSIGHEERLVTGSLSMRGKIQGHGRDPQGVLPSLNGQMDVMIQNGHVRRGTVLPQILAILNLPALLQDEVDLSREGFPFDTMTGTLVIKDGLVTSENVVMDSPIMKMTTAGNYHLKRDYLDMVAAVSPFGRYSDFMKTIPLFGKIIEGDRKGLATALFKITGTVEDPNVVYMPMESFTTGLTGFAQLAIDILTNTVTLPSDLLNSDSKESSGNLSPEITEEDMSLESKPNVPP